MRNEPSISRKNGEAEDDFLGQKRREERERERAEGTWAEEQGEMFNSERAAELLNEEGVKIWERL